MARAQTVDELVFLPLGGSGEIGMNLNLYGYGPPGRRRWIVVDLGVMFADERTPGIDLIMAKPDFLVRHREDILGLVLTHGHEDHIGAVAHLWPLIGCPIYATPFTAQLVRGKLADVGLGAVEVTLVPLGGEITLGPFEIELITITHSIPEPNAIAIRTPLGTVLHTGDWKIDPAPVVGETTDEAHLRELGAKGVLAMVCDSTNVFVPGESGSETDVRESLVHLVGELKGRVVITCFASNVARLDSIGRAARTHRRQLCLVGRSMLRIVEAAKSVGLLEDLPPIISEEEAAVLPRNKVLYACTGSQGEPRAVLPRVADGSHRSVALDAGDTVVFSSRVIPGNEVAIYELQNQLAEQGIRIVSEKDHFVHVSGHPCRDELTRMYQWVKPKVAIPVHGEARHLLEHAELARELQVPQSIVPRNGSIIRLAPGRAEIVQEMPVGRLYLDGRLLVDEDVSHLRDRRKISFVGYVSVTVVIGANGRVLADPEVRLQGVPEHDIDDGFTLKEMIEDAVDDALDEMSPAVLKRDHEIEDRLRQAARRPLLGSWGKKSVVDVVVVRV